MTRWLLAAEADKIQDFVFRSSRLVQVAGGSSLLSRFCAEVPRLLIERHGGDGEIVFAAGGGFRMTFGCCETAEAFGRDLAEAYYRVTDGTLTVARPQAYEEGGFAAAHDLAEADLRTKKVDRRDRCAAVAHLPYAAICASCGVSLATEHAARVEGEREMYLCRGCQTKGAERHLIDDPAAANRERFFAGFINALKQPGLSRASLPSSAEDLGGCDPRRYVAYVVADGNGTGVFFSRCKDPDKMRLLSDRLTDALWNALAAATTRLAPRLLERYPRLKPVPVLPLIVGGDDVFALLPAPYSLAFAQAFCLEFEREMAEAATSLNLEIGEQEYPTAAAAVVICKESYPYALAHRQGEALLSSAKRLGRRARLGSTENLSSVHFVVVRGGDADLPDGARVRGRKLLLPTIAPYWVSGKPLSAAADGFGLGLDALLQARFDLRGLPGKRQAELEHLFIEELPEELPGGRDRTLSSLKQEWQPRLQAMKARMTRGSDGSWQAVAAALTGLGQAGGENSPWRQFPGRDHNPWCHGLPDVLEMWDFAQDLGHSLGEYEEKEQ